MHNRHVSSSASLTLSSRQSLPWIADDGGAEETAVSNSAVLPTRAKNEYCFVHASAAIEVNNSAYCSFVQQN